MELEIKRLTSELAGDYLDFFDHTPHDDGTAENRCYCVCWSAADHRGMLAALEASTAESRRELAREYVRDGKLQGYLAYALGKPIGWCNANSKADCLHCESWLRFMRDAPVDGPNEKIKSVFCFVIAPEWRRKGVATKLLERVCQDAAAEGFDWVEAYPEKVFAGPAQSFSGPAAMYEKAGFAVCQRIGGEKALMRKRLKPVED